MRTEREEKQCQRAGGLKLKKELWRPRGSSVGSGQGGVGTGQGVSEVLDSSQYAGQADDLRLRGGADIYSLWWI
jgi:hypothetical protein